MLFNPHLYTNMSNYLRLGAFAAVKLAVQCWISSANGFICTLQYWTAGVLWNVVWKYVSERSRSLFYGISFDFVRRDWVKSRQAWVCAAIHEAEMRARVLSCWPHFTVPGYCHCYYLFRSFEFVGLTFWRCRCKTWSLTVSAMLTSTRNAAVSVQLALESLCNCLL